MWSTALFKAERRNILCGVLCCMEQTQGMFECSLRSLWTGNDEYSVRNSAITRYVQYEVRFRP